MIIDRKLAYWEQIEKVVDKAANVTTTLSRLVANIGGSKSSKRLVLLAVTQSVMLHRAYLGYNAPHSNTYVHEIENRVNPLKRRGALRVAPLTAKIHTLRY